MTAFNYSHIFEKNISNMIFFPLLFSVFRMYSLNSITPLLSRITSNKDSAYFFKQILVLRCLTLEEWSKNQLVSSFLCVWEISWNGSVRILVENSLFFLSVSLLIFRHYAEELKKCLAWCLPVKCQSGRKKKGTVPIWVVYVTTSTRFWHISVCSRF